jgi:hypothetical protein
MNALLNDRALRVQSDLQVRFAPKPDLASDPGIPLLPKQTLVRARRDSAVRGICTVMLWLPWLPAELSPRGLKPTPRQLNLL